jgi:large subunit ribosomal protein L21
MYAIIKTGGKQYRVAEGDIIDVELLHAEDGSAVEFTDVLFFFDGNAISVGAPTVANLIVKGEVLSTVAGPKVVSVKYRPSHNERRKFGHRQKYSRVKITSLASNKGKEKKHGS